MTPYNLHFLRILVFQKTHSLLRLIFRATGLRQKFKFDTFQKGLYNTLASSTNLVLKVVPIVTGVYLWRYFTCSYKRLIIFGLFHVLAQFTFSASETEPVYCDKKVKARVASRVSLWLKTKGNFKKIPEAFDTCAWKLHKTSCKTFQRKTYPTSFCEFVYNAMLKFVVNFKFLFQFQL